MISVWYDIARLIGEGIEDEAIGKATSAPGKPEDPDRRRRAAFALRDLYLLGQRREEEELRGHAGSAPTRYKVPSTYDPSEEERGESGSWEGPMISPDASNEEILKSTRGMRNNTSMSFHEWMDYIVQDIVMDFLAYRSERPGDRASIAGDILNSAVIENEDWLKSVYDYGISWDDALYALVNQKLGPKAGSYLPKVVSVFRTRAANDVRDRLGRAYTQDLQVKGMKPGASQVFQVPAEQTMQKPYFKKHMEQLRNMYRMYGERSGWPEPDEKDWEDLEFFLASPTQRGPNFEVLSKRDNYFQSVVDRLSSSIQQRQQREKEPIKPYDVSDPRMSLRSDPDDPTKTVSAGQVTALTRIPPESTTDVPELDPELYRMKFVRSREEPQKRKFPTWWDPFGFKGNIPFSDM